MPDTLARLSSVANAIRINENELYAKEWYDSCIGRERPDDYPGPIHSEMLGIKGTGPGNCLSYVLRFERRSRSTRRQQRNDNLKKTTTTDEARRGNVGGVLGAANGFNSK